MPLKELINVKAAHLAFLFIAGAVFSAPVSSQQLGGGGPYQVDAGLMGSRGVSWTKPQGSPYSLAVVLAPSTKEFDLVWEYSDTQHTASHAQTISLGYTPTAICRGDGIGDFFVGGTNRFGRTRIQRYIFDLPAHSAGALSDAVLDTTNVEVSLVSTPNSPTQDVYHLLRNQANGDLFVEFWSSRSIYSLELATSTLTEVVSKDPQSLLLIATNLELPHDFVYAREHNWHGYCYFFTGSTPEYTSAYTAVIRDEDKDGVLDDVLMLDRAAWNNEGFGDPDFYVDQ